MLPSPSFVPLSEDIALSNGMHLAPICWTFRRHIVVSPMNIRRCPTTTRRQRLRRMVVHNWCASRRHRHRCTYSAAGSIHKQPQRIQTQYPQRTLQHLRSIDVNNGLTLGCNSYRDRPDKCAWRKAFERWRLVANVWLLWSKRCAPKRVWLLPKRQPMRPAAVRRQHASARHCCWPHIVWRTLRSMCDSVCLWRARQSLRTIRSAVSRRCSMWATRCRCVGSTLGRG